jgi:DNA-binding NtrC family response regulator
MNLLITPSAHGQEYATAFLTATRIKTALVADVRTALHRLREDEFSAVVIDESLIDASSNQMEVFLKHLGTAVPVFVNLAVSRADRVSRDVVAALRRLEQERNAASQGGAVGAPQPA